MDGDGNGAVAVNELVAGVRSALAGCGRCSDRNARARVRNVTELPEESMAPRSYGDTGQFGAASEYAKVGVQSRSLAGA